MTSMAYVPAAVKRERRKGRTEQIQSGRVREGCDVCKVREGAEVRRTGNGSLRWLCMGCMMLTREVAA